eukprot:10132684-Alexandrium_andersonii.AAC.1
MAARCLWTCRVAKTRSTRISRREDSGGDKITMWAVSQIWWFCCPSSEAMPPPQVQAGGPR